MGNCFHWPYSGHETQDKNECYMRRRGCWCESCLLGGALKCETSSMTGEWCGPYNYWENYDENEDVWQLRMLQVTEHLYKFEPKLIGAQAVEEF